MKNLIWFLGIVGLVALTMWAVGYLLGDEFLGVWAGWGLFVYGPIVAAVVIGVREGRRQ